MIFFTIYGHENILSTHKTTFEFTKDSNLTKRGDCIVGVKADFNFSDLKKFIENNSNIKIKISLDGLEEIITAKINPDFDDQHEIVIRKTGFISKRTCSMHKSSYRGQAYTVFRFYY